MNSPKYVIAICEVAKGKYHFYHSYLNILDAVPIEAYLGFGKPELVCPFNLNDSQWYRAIKELYELEPIENFLSIKSQFPIVGAWYIGND